MADVAEVVDTVEVAEVEERVNPDFLAHDHQRAVRSRITHKSVR